MSEINIREEHSETVSQMIALLTKQGLNFNVTLHDGWWTIAINGY